MDETLQGWINLYKPKNISSFFAIKKIQSKFQIKKIGHCGTLDPMAEGILPIAIGKTTKLIPFVIKKEKKYIFTIKWGKQTSTDDAVSVANSGGRNQGTIAPAFFATSEIFGSSVETRMSTISVMSFATLMLQTIRGFPPRGRIFFLRIRFDPPRAVISARILITKETCVILSTQL